MVGCSHSWSPDCLDMKLFLPNQPSDRTGLPSSRFQVGLFQDRFDNFNHQWIRLQPAGPLNRSAQQ